MAKKIIIETEVKGGQTIDKAINGFSKLKAELREAKGELANFEIGTAGFENAQKKVVALTDKLGDLQDATKVQGTGVEKLGASFNLLKESLGTADIDKAKIAFQGIGAAMSAIPIFLLIEGLKYLYENFDQVVAIFKEFNGEAEASRKNILKLNSALSDLSYNLDEIEQRQKAITKSIEQRTALEIEAAKRRGASVEELAKIEIKAQAEKNEVLLKAEENYLKQKEFAEGQYYKALRVGDEESIKKADELYKRATQEYINSRTERRDAESKLELDQSKLRTLVVEEQKNKIKELEQAQDAAREKRATEDEKEQQTIAENLQKELDAENAALLKKESDRKAFMQMQINDQTLSVETRLQLLDLQYADELSKAVANKESHLVLDQQYEDKKKAIEDQARKQKQIEDAKQLQATQKANDQFLAAGANISKAYFNLKLQQVKGNAKEEEEIRKKAFKAEKAFSIARAIIDGARAINAALIIPPPAGPFLAIANGIAAAAQIGVIASQQYNGGGSESATSTLPAPSIPSIPETPTTVGAGESVVPNRATLFSTGQSQNATIVPGSAGESAPIRAYVVAQEMTSQQQLDAAIATKSTF